MKVIIKETKIEINFIDLLSEMDAEQKHELAEHLVWDKDIFDDLIERLATDTVVTSAYNYYLYQARLRLLELLPAMNRETIRSLLWELKRAREESQRMNRWAWKLYHAWPDRNLTQPKIEDHISTSTPTEADIDRVLAQEAGLPARGE